MSKHTEKLELLDVDDLLRIMRLVEGDMVDFFAGRPRDGERDVAWYAARAMMRPAWDRLARDLDTVVASIQMYNHMKALERDLAVAKAVGGGNVTISPSPDPQPSPEGEAL